VEIEGRKLAFLTQPEQALDGFPSRGTPPALRAR
jgi:hypothetical protein